MKVKTKVCIPLVMLLVYLADAEKEKIREEEEGSGRVFPLIPVFPFLAPYLDVDLIENWNRLISNRNAVYFLVRDAITVSIVLYIICIDLRNVGNEKSLHIIDVSMSGYIALVP